MEMNQKPKLDFETQKTYKIELIFDSPKTGKNAKGNDWYLYGVKHDGIEKNFFADYDLANELKKYSRGDVLEVTDNYQGENPYGHEWKVMSVGSNKPLDQQMKSRQNQTEVKIETWAAMKVATHFSKDIDALDINTQRVLELHKKLCSERSQEKEERLPF
tara:strand:- start:384 stop:863 length:480 start_codon:yes stop_codon:yes gene_type:complete